MAVDPSEKLSNRPEDRLTRVMDRFYQAEKDFFTQAGGWVESNGAIPATTAFTNVTYESYRACKEAVEFILTDKHIMQKASLITSLTFGSNATRVERFRQIAPWSTFSDTDPEKEQEWQHQLETALVESMTPQDALKHIMSNYSNLLASDLQVLIQGVLAIKAADAQCKVDLSEDADTSIANNDSPIERIGRHLVDATRLSFEAASNNFITEGVLKKLGLKPASE